MVKIFSDSFLKEMMYIVLFSAVVLKLGIFNLAETVNVAIFAALIYLLVKSARVLFHRRQKAVLFDFGGVVAQGDYFTQTLKIRKGIPELVKNLKKKNYKVALLTNQNAEVHDFLSKKYGLDRLFSEQIVSGKVGIKKPDPRIYEHALRKLNVQPKDTFFIDDKAENVVGAKRVGIKGIKFQSVGQVAKSIY